TLASRPQAREPGARDVGGVRTVHAACPGGGPMMTRLFVYLRGLLSRQRIDGEIAEELRDHLEREIEAHRARGVSAEEARRLALRDLGGLPQTLESPRSVGAHRH